MDGANLRVSANLRVLANIRELANLRELASLDGANLRDPEVSSIQTESGC